MSHQIFSVVLLDDGFYALLGLFPGSAADHKAKGDKEAGKETAAQRMRIVDEESRVAMRVGAQTA